MVWYSCLFKSFPQFVIIHRVEGFSTVNATEVDVFLEFPCFLCDPANVGNLVSGSSAFSKPSLNIWKFSVHIMLKPCWRGLRNSMKLWAMPFWATQDRWVIVESSDRMWSPGGGTVKPLQYTSRENPMNPCLYPFSNCSWVWSPLTPSYVVHVILI